MAPLVSDPVRKYARQAFQRDPKGQAGFDDYLAHLADPKTSASLPIELDTSHPISHYFISSSHNTYLSGNQLWSRSTAEAYKDVLKRACRCIEIDIWDGDSPSSSEAEGRERGRERGRDLDVERLTGMIRKGIGRLRSRSNVDTSNSNRPTTESPAGDGLMPTPWRTQSGRDEPVVYHGYTATTQLPFREVCEVVRKYAFRTSDLPVIVSLEIHCRHPSQEVVVDYMKTYWKDFLQPMPQDFCDSTPLPSLESLRKKILVKVKYVPPDKAKVADSTKDSDQESAEDDNPAATKHSKIIEKLSNLGIFTRAFHFHSFDQPEASIPTHVFSLSEGKLLSACEETPDKLFKHNLRHLMRAYPKGSRLRSSNLDPAPFWRFGLQMVALNFQKLNAAMMLQFAQFEGTGGWVLKPKGYLPVDGVQPTPERFTLDLTIKVFAGQGLGPQDDTPNAYVKCELHVESQAEAEENQIPNGGKAKEGEFKRQSTIRHSRNPDFGAETLVFKGVRRVIPELTFVRFKVMDDSLTQKDRLLGWACYRLDRMPQGILLVQLLGDDSKPCGSQILLDVQKVTSFETISPKRSL